LICFLVQQTDYGGHDINSGYNVEEVQGWTVMEFTRNMSFVDGNMDTAFTKYGLKQFDSTATYFRLAWSFDTIDPPDIRAVRFDWTACINNKQTN